MQGNRIALACSVCAAGLKHREAAGWLWPCESTSDGQPFFHGKETMRTWPPASVKSKDGSGIAPPVASRHGYATLRPFGPASFCRAPAVRKHVRKPDKTPCRQSPGGARVAGAGVERDVARTTPAQHPRALRYATASLSPRGPVGRPRCGRWRLRGSGRAFRAVVAWLQSMRPPKKAAESGSCHPVDRPPRIRFSVDS